MADQNMSLTIDDTNIEVEGTTSVDAPYTIKRGDYTFNPMQMLPKRLQNLLATSEQVAELSENDARMGYDVTEKLLSSGRKGTSRLGQIWHVANIKEGKRVPHKVSSSWLEGETAAGRKRTRYAVVYAPGDEGLNLDPIVAMQQGRITFVPMIEVAEQKRKLEPMFNLDEHHFRNYVLHLHKTDDRPDEFIIAMQCRVSLTERGTKAGDPQVRVTVHSGDGYRDAIITNTGFGKWSAQEKAMLGFMGRLDYQRQAQLVADEFPADVYATAWVTIANAYLGHAFEPQEGVEVAPGFHGFLKSVDDPAGRWQERPNRALPTNYLWRGAAINVAG